MDIDIEIAEKVMGWKKHETGFGLVYYPPNLHPMQNIIGHTVPGYSTDIAAAWQVVEKLRSDGMSCDIHVQFNRAYEVSFYRGRLHHTEQSYSLPMAICLAALKTKEV